MTRVSSRSSLDKSLEDPDLVLLIVFGGDGDEADAIHDLAVDKVTQPWRTTLLLSDRTLLTSAEKSAWKAAAARYVVLGVDDQERRVVSETGPLSDLLLADGTPSVLAIRQAFAAGEQA